MGRERCGRTRVALGIAACVVAGATAVEAQVRFADVAAARGLRSPGGARLGSGIAACDYDDDGDIDFFLPHAAGTPDHLYRNRGDGSFEEIAAAAGLAFTAHHRAALWFDFDGDHAQDLLVVGDCFERDCTGTTHLRLCRQVTPLRFEDVTANSGLPAQLVESLGQHLGGLAAGDVDRDGWLDVVITIAGGPARLYRNTGHGTFEDWSASSGIGVSRLAWQPVMHDFDRDGWIDILIAVDHFEHNLLWVNQRNGTFREAAGTAGLGNAMNDMGIALGDYDNDADLDVFVTNIALQDWHNVLHRNEGGTALRFTEVATTVGVADAGWAWGATFLDADQDGRLDLAVTNGFDGLFAADASRLLWNVGGDPVRFEDRSRASGFDDTDWGSSLVAFDADGDGDLDLAQTCVGTPLRLLENRSQSTNHWLVVRPRMSGANYAAIGTLVRVRAGRRTFVRPILAGTSFLGQEPAEACFGLGDAAYVDAIVVEWPDGSVSEHAGGPADRAVVVRHGATERRIAPFRVRVVPNPASAATHLRFTLTHSGVANVHVVDAAGRLVWSRVLTALPAGDHTLAWDGRDPFGGRVRSGTYFVRVTTLAGVATAKVSLVD